MKSAPAWRKPGWRTNRTFGLNMSFENHGARAFTAMSVQKNAPSASGVFGISSSREWIYIGETDDLRRQLLEHVLETNTFLKARTPTGFTFEICAAEGRVERQGVLVRELRPVCNALAQATGSAARTVERNR
jgi:hypothetical protein